MLFYSSFEYFPDRIATIIVARVMNWIIHIPEIIFTTRTDEDECLKPASDGSWDVMSNGEVGEVACRVLRQRRRQSAVGNELPAPQTLADNLIEIAVRRNGSDNMSVFIVNLKSKKKKQHARSRRTSRYLDEESE
ncbi:Protein phosphatase 2C [Cynara cardunculus var. scolymus]|uniref:Protein phosphatase 2C n=1 Tax=Cynara cardunculus var. scolymus TaxID=59895 RepID=A0A103Y2B9_CYNCS|nr:Protein phosphatase 2C [Cynara cardunculus var. scolymus]